MSIAIVTLTLSLMAKWSSAFSYNTFAQPARYHSRIQSTTSSFPPAFSSPPTTYTQQRLASFLAATTSSRENDEVKQSDDQFSWNARKGGWRPDVSDVEKISWGMPAKKKRTGSRGVPHRLNEDERRSFDQARRQGFLQVTGSSWRSQRRDAPLLNSYRSLMDARGRPMIVLHKLSSGEDIDRLDVDLSPLRLPDDFERVEQELKDRVLAQFEVESETQEQEEEEENLDEINDETIQDSNTSDDSEDGWETRPIYQLSPHSLSWEVSRQQGKQIGKFLGLLFDNIENKATKSAKPKGVKPGKGRRHGGYGI